MFEKRLVFSYCEGAYCTQIGNISREELSPRLSGSSVLKILFHEYFLDDRVFDIIFRVCDESDDVLSGGLFFDQERIRRFGGRGLNSFFFRLFVGGVSSRLRGLFRAIATEVSLFPASEAPSFFSKFFSFVIRKGW